MSSVTERLHEALLRPLAAGVISHSKAADKPLVVDLALPLPPRLRVYLYSLVSASGTVRAREFKIVLRLRGQVVGEYGKFDHSNNRFVVLAGYRPDLDVFVLWDASLHPRFKNGGNVQVRDTTVYAAITNGLAEQRRPLQSGLVELVIACRAARLGEALNARLAATGGILQDSWPASRS